MRAAPTPTPNPNPNPNPNQTDRVRGLPGRGAEAHDLEELAASKLTPPLTLTPTLTLLTLGDDVVPYPTS